MKNLILLIWDSYPRRFVSRGMTNILINIFKTVCGRKIFEPSPTACHTRDKTGKGIFCFKYYCKGAKDFYICNNS